MGKLSFRRRRTPTQARQPTSTSNFFLQAFLRFLTASQCTRPRGDQDVRKEPVAAVPGSTPARQAFFGSGPPPPLHQGRVKWWSRLVPFNHHSAEATPPPTPRHEDHEDPVAAAPVLIPAPEEDAMLVDPAATAQALGPLRQRRASSLLAALANILPPSPQALGQHLGRWQQWLDLLQLQLTLLQSLDPVQLRASSAETRAQVAARVLDLQQQATAVSVYLVTTLAHRNGLHQGFTSRAYLMRMGVVVLMCAVALYWSAFSSVTAGWRNPNIMIIGPNGEITHTLPDRGHEIIDWVYGLMGWTRHQFDLHRVPDMMVTCAVSFVLVVMVVLHPSTLRIIRQNMIVAAVLFWFRGWTVMFTTLPDASEECRAQFGSAAGAYKSQPMFPLAFTMTHAFLLNPTKNITCGDMMFSGKWDKTCVCVCDSFCRYICRLSLSLSLSLSSLTHTHTHPPSQATPPSLCSAL